MDKRSKEITLGQSSNQALDILLEKKYNPDDKEMFLKKHEEYALMMYKQNLKLSEIVFNEKGKDDVDDLVPCPKCGDAIPKNWNAHFKCGWEKK